MARRGTVRRGNTERKEQKNKEGNEEQNEEQTREGREEEEISIKGRKVSKSMSKRSERRRAGQWLIEKRRRKG